MPVFEERLRQLGEWLGVNGEAIYESRAWKYQNDTKNSDVWYTQRVSNVYAILLKYPSDAKVLLAAPTVTEATSVSMLGYSGAIQWIPSASGQGLVIDLSGINIIDTPSQVAWVFKLENVSYN